MQRFFVMAMLCLCVWVLPGFAQANTQVQTVEVDLTPGPDAVEIVYRFAKPVSGFEWSVYANGLRTLRLTALDDVSFKGKVVSAPTPRHEFRFRLRADTEPKPATYAIAKQTLEGGWTVYDPYLQIKDADIRLHYQINGTPRTYSSKSDVSHYLSLRGADAAPFETKPWFVGFIRAELKAARTSYSRAFGPLTFEPEIIFTRRVETQQSLSGDVDDTRQIVFTLPKGPGWDVPSESARRQIRTVVWHESFHLWNSLRSRNMEGDAIVWEGSAEYMSYALLLKDHRISGADFSTRLTQALDKCSAALTTNNTPDWRKIGGWVIYDCGFVQQWLADGAPTHFESVGYEATKIWAGLLKTPRYSTDQFVDLAKAHSTYPAFEAAIKTADWIAFSATLKTQGVAIQSEAKPLSRLVFDLAKVVIFSCPPGQASGAGSGPWWLDTKGNCGELSNRPEITAVGEIDLDAEPLRAAEYIEAVCARQEALTFSHKGHGFKGTITCKGPFPPPPQTFAIDFKD